MMFLEYVIWGSWLPLLSLYLTRSLHLSGSEIGWIFATQAIASVTALFVSGQIADRYLRTDRFLAFSHLVGGLAMFALAYQRTFWSFFLIMLVHSLAYVPTLSLTNSICFHHLKDAQKEFGRVRLWGTIGWIAASWPFVLDPEGQGRAGHGRRAGQHLRGRRASPPSPSPRSPSLFRPRRPRRRSRRRARPSRPSACSRCRASSCCSS